MIEAIALGKYYDAFVALSDVSFSIPRGQVVALLGPNGAGKTTLMRILSGYFAPSVGTARVAGFDVVRDRLDVAARTGYLPENGPVYPDMTPLDALRFAARVRRLGATRFRHRLDAVASACDLAAVIDKPIGKLSKGLRQRVGLALALLHDPEILLLDEPTSGLDPNQIAQFRTQLRELRRDKTIVVSTHLLHEVEATADRVLLVHNGRLAFDGTPAELAAGTSLDAAFERLTGAPAHV